MRNERGDAGQWRVGEVVEDRYEVRQIHTDGGMGLVYRVWHRGWACELAVKSPRAEHFKDQADQDRFVTEAQTWVSLGLHPNVCSCHYVRTVDGVPRVFAEYVDGGSLADRIADRRLYAGGGRSGQALGRVLDIAVQFAWGLDFAHERGLVHQDVKPANLLLTGDGTAKVTDFGIASARPAGSGPVTESRPGASVLTPSGFLTRSYASPEQMAGRKLDRRTDVYSYAVSVLEMFTGGVTWMAGPAAGSALDHYRAAGSGEPDLPVMPDRLAETLARCLSEEPGERPATMGEVAGIVVAVYESELGERFPRPVPVAARLRADELNNRGVSLLDLGLGDEAERAFDEALTADPRHLDAVYNRALTRWRAGLISDADAIAAVEDLRGDGGDGGGSDGRGRWELRHALAQLHGERGDVAVAAELLASLAGRGGAGPGRGAEPGLDELAEHLRGLTPAVGETVRAEWRRHDDTYTAWQERDRYNAALAITRSGVVAVSGTFDGLLELWDVGSGRRLTSFPAHEGKVSAVAIGGPGIDYAATAGHDGNVIVWHLDTGRSRTLGAGGPAHFVGLNEAGDRLVVHAGPNLAAWDFHDDGFLPLKAGPSWSTAISADGRWAITSPMADDQHDVVQVWDLTAGRRHLSLPGHTGPVHALHLDDNGRRALTGGRDRTIRVWDLASGECTRVLHGGMQTSAVAFTPDGEHVVSVDHTSVRYWDLASGRCVRTQTGHTGKVGALAVPREHRAVTLAQGNTIRTWPLPIAEHTRRAGTIRLSRPRASLHLARLDAQVDGLIADAERAVGAGDAARALHLMTAARGVEGHERTEQVMGPWRALGRIATRTGLRGAWPLRDLTGHTAAAASVAIARDVPIVVTGGRDRDIRVWELDRGECLRVLRGHTSFVNEISVSADGRYVLSAHQGARAAWLWDVGAGTWSALPGDESWSVFPGDENVGSAGGLGSLGYNKGVALSADARTAVIADISGVTVWDVASGQLLRQLRRGKSVEAVALSADSRFAVIGHDARRNPEAAVWDIATGRTVGLFPSNHTDMLKDVAISGDGSTIVTAGHSRDRTLRVWDTASGTCRQIMTEPAAASNACQLTADGRHAISATMDGRLAVWDTGSGRLLGAFDAHKQGTGAVALSGDGNFVVTASIIRPEVRVWAVDWELGVE